MVKAGNTGYLLTMKEIEALVRDAEKVRDKDVRTKKEYKAGYVAGMYAVLETITGKSVTELMYEFR